jgi:hypothetical protein
MSNRRVGVPIPETIDPSAPLRLDVAAKIAFPDRSMTASGFRSFSGTIIQSAPRPTAPPAMESRAAPHPRPSAQDRETGSARGREDQAGHGGGSGIAGPPSCQGSRRAAPQEPLAQEIICKAEDQK